MYEAFFGFGKRPFTAMPDAECFVPVDGSYQALSSLAQCARDGRGIGVLTAPAGSGKSLICQRLIRELESRFSVVYLPSGNYLTRRSLLQAILFELGHSYLRMGDQELRLALTSVLRRLRPGRGAIALIVDEAHLLAPRMLEELRTLTNFAEGGESLVRLVISGQLPLEETLSQPSLHAFNQRIGIQVTLDAFTRDESAEYVSRRIAWAGANSAQVLTSAALATICEASDGSPRCLNQLCDHSLLIGYLASEKPVSDGTVREALEDLKQLPLVWNEPLRRPDPIVECRKTAASQPGRIPASEDAWIVTADNEIVTPRGDMVEAVEFGHAVESVGDSFEVGAFVAATATLPPRATALSSSPKAKATATVIPVPKPEAAPRVTKFDQHNAEAAPQAAVSKAAQVVVSQAAASQIVDEEVVIDRYAALDAAISRLTRTMLCARAIARRGEAVSTASAKQAAPSIGEEESDSEGDSRVFDVVLPEEAPAEATRDGNARTDSRSRPAADAMQPLTHAARRYELLFSELRRRRKGA